MYPKEVEELEVQQEEEEAVFECIGHYSPILINDIEEVEENEKQEEQQEEKEKEEAVIDSTDP